MVIPSLPWELESEILSRVPPTSVKQLRFTCKRWNALFKDYKFIKNHLCKAATQMVLKKDKSVYSFSFDFHGIHNRYDQLITFTGKLLSLKDSEDVEIYKTFHCEGLLLCTTKDNRLVVWNPCTGQTRWIQSRLPINSYTEYQTCFLGYGNKNKSCYSFKILRFTDYYHQTERVGSDDEDLKGNSYWLDSDVFNPESEHYLVNFILRFDFTTERFERLSLPSQSDDSEAGEVISHWVLSVVREEKLALLSQNFVYYSPLEMKIWMTNTKADEVKDLSWSKFFFFLSQNFH
uniref:F-box domain-containing protein n=1 Tax=Brassica oleracea var. oleracea TaxID=109376 RepID=A0A0D3BBS8_BRAOL